MRPPPLLLLPILVLFSGRPGAAAEEVVAISSVTFNGYTRERQPDGTFKPESFIFGEGGGWTRPISDPAMDKIKFPQVARTIAGPLAKMSYHPTRDPVEAGLLILVFWGSTQGSRGHDPSQSVDRAAAAIGDYSRSTQLDSAGEAGRPVNTNTAEGAAMDAALWQLALSNRERDQLDDRNARILGYTEALETARFVQHMAMGRDLLDEIGSNRYYVVLQAYDNRVAVREKKLKPLWTTRLSVSEDGDFARALEAMVWTGARLFGQDSKGLRRREVHEGSVKLAPLEVLETVPPK